MVLLEWTLSNGERKKCDARCYNSPITGCDCICRGANHGKGIEAALASTQENADRWRRNHNARKNALFARETHRASQFAFRFVPAGERGAPEVADVSD